MGLPGSVVSAGTRVVADSPGLAEAASRRKPNLSVSSSRRPRESLSGSRSGFSCRRPTLRERFDVPHFGRDSDWPMPSQFWADMKTASTYRAVRGGGFLPLETELHMPSMQDL